MAILDAINRVTGKNVGGSIEDALAYMQQQQEQNQYDPTFVPVIRVATGVVGYFSKPLLDIITGFNDGNVKQCVVIVDGVSYQTSMVNTILTLDQNEDPDESTLSIAFINADLGTDYVIGVYDHKTETPSWRYIEGPTESLAH